MAELQHLRRHLITVISAICRQTVDEATPLEEFNSRFAVRLAPLSRVQGLLSQVSAGQRVTSGQLLQSELDVIGALRDRVVLAGPDDVPLRLATAEKFSLALHELTTNSLKHEALAAGGARLRVRWGVSRAEGGRHRLRVEWRETGVDIPGAVPQGSGYGQVLIEHALPY